MSLNGVSDYKATTEATYLPGWHMTNTGFSYLFFVAKCMSSYQVWFGGYRVKKYKKRACTAFQVLKTSISLVHDFEDHIHYLSLGV